MLRLRSVYQVSRILSSQITSQAQHLFPKKKVVYSAQLLSSRNLNSTQYFLNQTHSQQPLEIEVIELKSLLPKIQSNSDDYILIDVREPSERQEGFIPTSYHLPLGDVDLALRLPETLFKSRYGFDKPKLEDNKPIIFHCRSGVRSNNAATLAKQQGYNNVLNYKGSWSEFSKEHPELIKKP